MGSKYGNYSMRIYLHRALSINLYNRKYLTRVSLNIPLCYRLLDLCKEARYRANGFNKEKFMPADYRIVITGLEVHYVVFEVPLFFESSKRYLSRTIILNTH